MLIEIKEGVDVTEILGITKYVVPIPACLSGTVKGNFPSFIPKTDETRIQSDPALYEAMADLPVVITEKLEGTSCTVYWKDHEFGVCSRNWNLQPSENAYWKAVRAARLDQAAINDLAIQGELCGPGIQSNIYGLPHVQLFVFRMWDLREGRLLSHDQMAAVALSLGLQTVPVLYNEGSTLRTLYSNVDQIMESTRGTSALNPTVQREGLVFSVATNDTKQKIGFKAINPDYLL